MIVLLRLFPIPIDAPEMCPQKTKVSFIALLLFLLVLGCLFSAVFRSLVSGSSFRKTNKKWL